MEQMSTSFLMILTGTPEIGESNSTVFLRAAATSLIVGVSITAAGILCPASSFSNSPVSARGSGGTGGDSEAPGAFFFSGGEPAAAAVALGCAAPFPAAEEAGGVAATELAQPI